MSTRSKQVQSLFAIVKVGQSSVEASQMANCAVQHEVIIITCHSPFSSSFGSFRLGLGKRRRAEVLVALANPTEYTQFAKYVKYAIYDKHSNIKPTYLSKMLFSRLKPR